MSGPRPVESDCTEHTELSTALRELQELRTAMRTRPAIEQAKGILMARHHCDADAAFAMLRSASMRDNRKLSELAACIVASVASVASVVDGQRPAGKPCAVETGTT